MNILLITLLLSIQLEANRNAIFDYRPASYYSMLENSDVVVLTEIIDQTDSTATLKIEKTLKGSINEPTLELKKFKDWPCASRHHEYKIGQKQINILRNLKDGRYVGMSPGNEGELPVDSGYVYCKSWLNSGSEYAARYGKISGFRFKFEDSMEGLQRIIRLTDKISSEEKNCKLLILQPKSTLESMIIEEQILRMRLKNECEKFDEFKFKVTNLTWWSY